MTLLRHTDLELKVNSPETCTSSDKVLNKIGYTPSEEDLS